MHDGGGGPLPREGGSLRYTNLNYGLVVSKTVMAHPGQSMVHVVYHDGHNEPVVHVGE